MPTALTKVQCTLESSRESDHDPKNMIKELVERKNKGKKNIKMTLKPNKKRQ